jgi:hypothetical protein
MVYLGTPKCLSSLSAYTVKRHLKVYEVNIKGWGPLLQLLYDDAKAESLVGTGFVPAEPCLQTSEFGVDCLQIFRTLENRAQHWQEHDAIVVAAAPDITIF